MAFYIILLFRYPTPHCRWFQRDTYIFLTVEVMDCQDPDISVLDNKLVFTCIGDDMKKYELEIELLQSISSKVEQAKSLSDSRIV